MPLRIRSHIVYPVKPKPDVVAPKKPMIANTLFAQWSPREDAVLRSSYEKDGPKKIAEKIGRTPGAVTQRYRKITARRAA